MRSDSNFRKSSVRAVQDRKITERKAEDPQNLAVSKKTELEFDTEVAGRRSRNEPAYEAGSSKITG